MPLVTMNEILIPARKMGYAVGAFEFWSLDSAQAVVEAAQELNMPVILQAGPLECKYADGMKNLGIIARAAIEKADIPVALHLDHGDSMDLVRQSIDAGFTSVMIDVSHLTYEDNVKITKEVVALAKTAGVSVESELGRVGGTEAGSDYYDGESFQTDPDEASNFVEETGIDALAVAIGTVHGFYRFEPKINLQRLKSIYEKVSIPLVLHGGSGTPEEAVIQSIKHGIAKINICTEFVASFGKEYMKTQNNPDFKYNVPALFEPSKKAGRKLALEKIRLFSMQG